MRLNPEHLHVASFSVTPDTTASISPDGGYCCTGCVSGCGINPTASGCASASGDMVCPAQPIDAAA